MDRTHLGYILILLVVLFFLYVRFVRGSRRKTPHGRELWRQRLKERRDDRVQGAHSWEERRRRKERHKPGWKIADLAYVLCSIVYRL